MSPIALAVHGGAGLIRRDSLTAEREAECLAGLRAALVAGRAVLEAGGGAVDAVEAAVMSLEEDPRFNAGRGGVLTASGEVELDASIMDGRERRAGAVCLVRRTRNPVRLARAVMDRTPHVLLGAEAADALAAELGLEQVEPAWFVTEERRQQWEAVRGSEVFALDHGGRAKDVYGTVGAVALDGNGHLAAATSTGGMVNKRPGRVGDSPIIAAGTWAEDGRCAVSATGHGEVFIRRAAAARVAALMELAGLSLVDASERLIRDELPPGAGGLIAVDAAGNVVLPFNTAGMFRGAVHPDGRVEVAIW